MYTNNKVHPRAGVMVARCLTAMLCLLLGGCNIDSMGDLVAFVDEVNARPGSEIEPVAMDSIWDPVPNWPRAPRRDPFQPFTTAEKVPFPSPLPPHPDLHRAQELEAFPLDSLRMVGTVSDSGQFWGLVRTPEGHIHRVRSGNYLGQNNGKVVAVAEGEIELFEIYAHNGAWYERPAKLALTEAF